MPFNLEEIVRNRERPVGIEAYLLAQAYKSLEAIQKDADKIQKRLNKRWLTWKEISSYLQVEFSEHFRKFQRYNDDPEAPKILLDGNLDDDDESSWQIAGNDSRNEPVFEQWLHGMDIKRAKSMIQAMENSKQKQPPKDKKKGKSNPNIYSVLDNYDEFGDYYDFEDYNNSSDEYYEPIYDSVQNFLSNWQEPTTNRPLEVLKNDSNVWQMSKTERITLHDFWRYELNIESVEELAQLQKTHDEKRKEVENIHNERRKKILKECDVIGMTTNGAAKFQSLIRSIGTRVILCEEAGEVLEAHILSALTPSTQHLILIGGMCCLFLLNIFKKF